MVASGFGGVLLDFFGFFFFWFGFGLSSARLFLYFASSDDDGSQRGVGRLGYGRYHDMGTGVQGIFWISFFFFLFDWDTKGCTNDLIIKDTNGWVYSWRGRDVGVGLVFG